MSDIVTPVDHATAFVQTVFKPFKLDWQVADPLPRLPGIHLRGIASGTVIDLVCHRGKVKHISMALKQTSENTILMVHILSCLRPDVTHRDTDQWLARTLDSLPRDRLGSKRRQWSMWDVQIATQASGVCTMIVKPRVV